MPVLGHLGLQARSGDVILFVRGQDEHDDDVVTASMQTKMAKDRRLMRDQLEAYNAAASGLSLLAGPCRGGRGNV